MKIIHTIEEAKDFFLNTRDEKALVTNGKESKECETYPEAKDFLTPKA